MANVSRMEMLRAMAERPMSGQELAQKLNLNSGSVFRDLNSLYNALAAFDGVLRRPKLLPYQSTGGSEYDGADVGLFAESGIKMGAIFN